MNPLDFLAKSNGVKLHEHTEHVRVAAKSLLDGLPLTSEEKADWLPILMDCALLHDMGRRIGFSGELKLQNAPNTPSDMKLYRFGFAPLS
ncbi:MAG: hypothetical protein IPN20_22715 [Haliscomenobacter sp.]|nr:hypothetical protein [Haliscomenobacter sp.]